MQTNPAVDDFAAVRLTLSEWAAVITALEKQADAEATLEGEQRYRRLTERVLFKAQHGPNSEPVRA